MARKQSSKIYFQGKYHNEIYFQGHYHDKMYIGNQLVWEKLSNEYYIGIAGDVDFDTLNSSFFKFGAKAVYNNELYGIGTIYKYEDIYFKQKNAVCKFDYEKRQWIYIASHSDAYPIHITNLYPSAQDMIANKYGVGGSSEGHYRFYGFDGKSFAPPKNTNKFVMDVGLDEVLIANRGTIEFYYTDGEGENVERGIAYKDFVGNIISKKVFDVNLYQRKLTENNGIVYMLGAPDDDSGNICIYKVEIGDDDSISYKLLSSYHAYIPVGIYPRYINFYFYKICGKLYICATEYKSSTEKQNVYFDLNFNMVYQTGDFRIATIYDDIMILVNNESIKKISNGNETIINAKYPILVLQSNNRYVVKKDNDTNDYHLYCGTYEIKDDGTIENKESVTDLYGYKE